MFWDENIVRSFLKIFELRAWSHFLNILRKKKIIFFTCNRLSLFGSGLSRPGLKKDQWALTFIVAKLSYAICHMHMHMPYCHIVTIVTVVGISVRIGRRKVGNLHCHDYRDDHHDRHHDHHDDRHNLSVRIARGLRRRGRSSSTWTVRPRTWQSQMILMKSFREIIMNMVTRSCSDPDYIENMNLTSAFRSLYQSSDCTPTIGPWWDIFARN